MDRDILKPPCRTDIKSESFLAQIQEGYPEQKPVCFNYIKAREDILMLCSIIQKLTGEKSCGTDEKIVRKEQV